jgi:hypothetical protein
MRTKLILSHCGGNRPQQHRYRFCPGRDDGPQRRFQRVCVSATALPCNKRVELCERRTLSVRTRYPNGSPGAAPKAKAGPSGDASKDNDAPK